MARIRLGSRSFELPRNRIVRIAVGVLLILGGFIGFLPILGFWMAPLGLLVLAADIPQVRRFNRRSSVAIVGWWRGRKSRQARNQARATRPPSPSG